MKKLLTATALALLPFGALAADLPRRTSAPAPAPVMVVAPTWAGVYAGVHAGYSGGSPNALYENEVLRNLHNIDIKSDGFLGGAQVGFNAQVIGHLYVGIEVSASLLNVEGRMADTLAGGGETIGARSKWGVAVGPRIGYGFGNLMPFVMGGFSIANATNTSTALASKTDKTLEGWYLGLGFEYKILTNVSLKVDYARYWFGSERYNETQIFSSRAKPSSDMLRVGLNYHFGAPAGAVVARY